MCQSEFEIFCRPVNSAGNPTEEDPENVIETEDSNTVPSERPINVEENAQNSSSSTENAMTDSTNTDAQNSRSNTTNGTE